MKRVSFLVSILFCYTSFSLKAINVSPEELSPWLSPFLTISADASYKLKRGSWSGKSHVSTSKRTQSFLLLGLKASPMDETAVEVRTENAKSISCKIRKQLLDDLLGDKVATTAGIEYTLASQPAVKNPFYELFAENTFFLDLAVGRHLSIKRESEESTVLQTERSRYTQLFGALRYAQPTRGQGAFGMNLTYLNRFQLYSEFYITADGWQGVGHNRDTRPSCYHGLAHERFTVLDLACGLKHELTGIGTIDLNICSRVLRKNALHMPLCLRISFSLPISI